VGLETKAATLHCERWYTNAGSLNGRFAREKPKNAFLKNEAGDLLKTNGQPKKRAGNEAGHFDENKRA